MDYKSMDRLELQNTSDAARQELAKRQTEDVFRAQMAKMQDQYVEAFGNPHEWGETWSAQPYPLTAYRLGDVVIKTGGKYYRSLVPNNTFDPEDRGWRQINKDGSPRPFAKPQYDHDGYMTGERAISGGILFEANRDYVMETPSRQAVSWDEVEEPEENENAEPEDV